MNITILGSGGCTVTPKPLCQCRVCVEARRKGVPYERTGPSLFIHDENVLVDAPAEVAKQLNSALIQKLDTILLTHLDPDHIEGLRVVEQITLDFRSWEAYPHKQIELRIPIELKDRLKNVQSAYGSLIDYYEAQGFVKCSYFEDKVKIGNLQITGVPIDRGDQVVYIYVFEKKGTKLVYAPCDLKPFPEHRKEITEPDILVIQPGIFEDGLKHGFTYPEEHISRKTLYTIDETLSIAKKIRAKEVVFTHLEEYWNRSYDDYKSLQFRYKNVFFAYDGMQLRL